MADQVTRKYIIRYVKTSYLEIEVEGTDMDDARNKGDERKKEFDDTYHDCYGVQTYPSREDMICRVNDKGQRAKIPLDEDDNEIAEVDDREWGR